MKKYHGYLIDLDGTLFRGTERIDGALEFIEWLHKQDVPYLYLTNNSTRTPEQVAEKLRQFGFPATAEQVYTSALAAAQYVKQELNAPSVFVIGEEGLQQAFRDQGIRLTDENPDVVVSGLDRAFTYDKMKKACLSIRAGATFIGTNADRALPTEAGLLPGSGSLAMGMAYATGVDPLFIGKPEPIIMRLALQALGVPPERVLVIGDNLDTDILAGVRSGIDTLLVFTGITTREMARASAVRATYEVENLRDWIKREKGE
ncbi:TIGR01457 family HAD-type hydrolase [Laceyella putida]|uniref:Acid sugar phosphatase n=1 Tax=Laceyella putida TaxID=110101 RepID=A0ABW2RFI9_9BACL